MQFLPYLEVDGGKLVISQAPAIMRYLAKSFRPGIRWSWFIYYLLFDYNRVTLDNDEVTL